MNELIYNQNQIPKQQWRYGLRSSAVTGCGWIATYNALRLMGYHPKPEKLICWYERNVPLINGNLGTFVLSPVMFFKKNGFRVTVTAKRKEFDATVKDSDVCILFYYWYKKHKIGAHYVAVRFEDGEFIGYNTFRNSAAPDRYGCSLERFLKNHQYLPLALIAIRDREK